jgi:hypothetical protein
MKLTLATLALAFALPLAAGEQGSWTGMLADAACKQRTPTAACPVDGGTRQFGLVTVQGDFLPFDAEGNRKAAEALKASAADGNPIISVTGETDGKSVAVETIQLS